MVKLLAISVNLTAEDRVRTRFKLGEFFDHGSVDFLIAAKINSRLKILFTEKSIKTNPPRDGCERTIQTLSSKPKHTTRSLRVI